MSLVQLETTRPAQLDKVRFHLSLNVDDLPRSIDFFQILFDAPPTKRELDYAKFEIDEPALVLSLAPNRVPAGGKLNHLGFRLTSGEALVAMQRRLESHGLKTEREDGVECCYARQTKFWLNDPDGNLWELYTLEEDLDPRDGCHVARPASVAAPVAEPVAPAPSIWAHRLGEPFPERLMIESAGVDEVFLQGTFNAQVSPARARAMLAEVLRVLKPGATVSLHQLSARSSLDALARPLPGPAAAVQAVPSAAQLVDDLQAAGFVDIRFEKLAAAPCFMADGVECRETRVVACKPLASQDQRTYQVLYKGPLRQIVDDRGNSFERGRWVTVDAATHQQLQAAVYRDQFVL